MSHKFVQNLTHSPRAIGIVVLTVMLPLVVLGAFIVQSRRSQATGACAPEDIKTTRTSQSAGQISFRTPCAVKTQLYCSTGRDGVQFLCGEDVTEATSHLLQTTDVTLNSGIGYYVFIDSGLENRSVAYIQADPVDATLGRNINSFNDEAMGTVVGEPEYDVALDINQDGMINGMDRTEFYTEEE